MSSLRHPLGRVRGLGSAKEGSGHWLHQRFSSIALIPLSIWLAWGLFQLDGSYADARTWVAQPMNAALLIAFALVTFHHAKAGLQVVIEDYVHSRWLEVTLQVANLFLNLLAALVSVFAIVRIALGA